jgi:hypothetical protein
MLLAVGAVALAWQTGARAGELPAAAPAPAAPMPSSSKASTPAQQLPAAGPAKIIAPSPVLAANGACFDSADNCGGGCHLVGGGGFDVVKPIWDTNPAFNVFTVDATGHAITNGTIDFDYDYHLAPYVWLGIASDGGVGVRGRFYYYNQNTSQSLANSNRTTDGSISTVIGEGRTPSPTLLEVPGSTDVLTAEHSLKLYVYDLEATYEDHCGSVGLLFAGGVRYAQLTPTYHFALRNSANTPGGPLSIADDSAGFHFNGVGPTFAIEAYVPVSDAGLSAYADLRFSALFGRNTQTVTTFDEEGAGPPLSSENTRIHTIIVPVIEPEVGVQWYTEMGGLRPFVRAGVVDRIWTSTGNGIRQEGVLQLFGVTVCAGFTF